MKWKSTPSRCRCTYRAKQLRQVRKSGAFRMRKPSACVPPRGTARAKRNLRHASADRNAASSSIRDKAFGGRETAIYGCSLRAMPHSLNSCGRLRVYFEDSKEAKPASRLVWIRSSDAGMLRLPIHQIVKTLFPQIRSTTCSTSNAEGVRLCAVVEWQPIDAAQMGHSEDQKARGCLR